MPTTLERIEQAGAISSAQPSKAEALYKQILQGEREWDLLLL
jgi:hypothetical protein